MDNANACSACTVKSSRALPPHGTLTFRLPPLINTPTAHVPSETLYADVLFLRACRRSDCLRNNPYPAEKGKSNKLHGSCGGPENPRPRAGLRHDVCGDTRPDPRLPLSERLPRQAVQGGAALAAAIRRSVIFYEQVQERGRESVARMNYTFRLRDDIYFQDDPCFPGGKGRCSNYARRHLCLIKRLADPAVQVTGYSACGGEDKDMDVFFKKAGRPGVRPTIPSMSKGYLRPTTAR